MGKKGLQEQVAEIKDREKQFWAMRRVINEVNGKALFGITFCAVVGAVFFYSMFTYPDNSELAKQQQENLRLMEEAKRKREGR